MAGEMGYLTDRRAGLRDDPRHLLPSARSILCVGKLYNGPQPYSTRFAGGDLAWISRYAWGEDYHQVLRRGLARVVDGLRALSPSRFEWKICVDTAPLLERAYARHAGLGWIAKNTCLINQAMGSWFFLGELLLSLDLAPDQPPPDRCGTCTRCIDACPTEAIVPTGLADGPAWALDSRLCISYFTIELRGVAPVEARPAIGRHVFGCDICQDVCPWNRRAPATEEPAFAPRISRRRWRSWPRFPKTNSAKCFAQARSPARAVCGLPAQRGHRHGQCAAGELSRAARKAGRLAGAGGERSRALGVAAVGWGGLVV
jgi:epoxyqueuosine reductase